MQSIGKSAVFYLSNLVSGTLFYDPEVCAHVFWDIENCQIPKGISADALIDGIKKFVCHEFSASKCSIVVAGCMKGISLSNHMQLSTSGVKLKYTDGRKKQSADFALVAELMDLFIASERNPGKNVFIFITGDSDFKEFLSILRSKSYRVLLIYSSKASYSLLNVASSRVLWSNFIETLKRNY